MYKERHVIKNFKNFEIVEFLCSGFYDESEVSRIICLIY